MSWREWFGFTKPRDDPDTELPQIEDVKKLKDLETTSAKWSGSHIEGISISCGLASSEEFSDFDSVMKAADQRMYENKQNYYRISGKERRR